MLQKFHQLVTFPVVMKTDQPFYTEIKHTFPASPGLGAGKGRPAPVAAPGMLQAPCLLQHVVQRVLWAGVF